MTACKETIKETNEPEHGKTLKLGFRLRWIVLAF